MQAIYAAGDPRLSLLLALETNRLRPGSADGRQALLSSFQLISPELTTFLESKSATRFAHVAFAADGTTLIAASPDGAVFRYDQTTHTRRATALRGIPGSSGAVGASALSPNGTVFARDTNAGIALQAVATGTQYALLTGVPGGVQSLAFSADGQTIAVGSFDGPIFLWDVATGAPAALRSRATPRR